MLSNHIQSKIYFLKLRLSATHNETLISNFSIYLFGCMHELVRMHTPWDTCGSQRDNSVESALFNMEVV